VGRTVVLRATCFPTTFFRAGLFPAVFFRAALLPARLVVVALRVEGRRAAAVLGLVARVRPGVRPPATRGRRVLALPPARGVRGLLAMGASLGPFQAAALTLFR